jgi:CRISPR/Cas system-associated endonuclease/helicase Cas3
LLDGIKSTINTANDIGEIAKYVDNLLEGEKQVQQQRAKKSGSSISEQFGIESVAQEVIDARIAQEKIQEMRNLVDMRFGPGTWQSIVDLRNQRIREAKEAALKAKREAMQQQEEIMEAVKIAAGIGVVVAISVGLFIFLLTNV